MVVFSIEILLQIILLLVLLLAILTIFLVFNKKIEDRQEKNIQKYMKEKQEEWFLFFREEKEDYNNLIPKNSAETKACEKIFISYTKNVSNPGIHNKIKIFSNQYLADYYGKLLKSKRWSQRMNALYRIIDFQMISLLDQCKELENRKITNDEYFLLLNIYAIFLPDLFFSKIFDAKVELSEYEYKKLIMSGEEELIEKLMSRYQELPTTGLYSLIDIIGKKLEINALSFLEDLLEDENPEIRIKSLKAIYEIGVIFESNKYVRLVESKLWEERLMVARLFEVLPVSSTLPHLKKLLVDDSWWVRAQAAKTIRKYKNGKEILTAYIESGTDPYAIDIANEVLKKGTS